MRIRRQALGDAARFWAEFLAKEDALFGSEPPPDEVTDELLADLTAYGPDLGFEISSEKEGKKELVLTAYGDRKRFAQIAALVAAAPPMPRWTVVGLKRATGFGFTQDRAGIRLCAADLLFHPYEERTADGRLRIAVYVPNASSLPEDVLWACVETTLMSGLGERSYAEVLGDFAIFDLTARAREKALPIQDLPRYLRWDLERHPRTRPGGS
jgi:hypothetical protein